MGISLAWPAYSHREQGFLARRFLDPPQRPPLKAERLCPRLAVAARHNHEGSPSPLLQIGMFFAPFDPAAQQSPRE